MSDIPCRERPPRYDHTPDHTPTMHGEKGYCKVCLVYDFVAETQSVDYGGVHLGLRWTPCVSVLEIEARKRLAGLLAAPQPGPAVTPPVEATPVQLTAVERALILYTRNPSQSLRKLAREVGCDVSLLSRDERIQRLRDAYGGKIPRGSKSKEGDLEAWDEDG